MKKISTLLMIVLVLFFTLSCLSQPLYEGVAQKSVFVSGEEGYFAYRIPSLLALEGQILAFAEGRLNGFSDTGNIDLVMKRSLDGGKNWSKLSVIWSEQANCCGNPCPVIVEGLEGKPRIVMLACWNDGRDHESEINAIKGKDIRKIYSFYSDDLGLTWSKPVEITDSVKKANWSGYATGPGVGLVLTQGKNAGRIIIPCDHFNKDEQQYASHLIYSDDGGINWAIGAIGPIGSNESQVVETTEGSLIMTMRRIESVFLQPYQLKAISLDGGISFIDSKENSQDHALLAPACQASLLNSMSEKQMWFSNPESKKREKMTVKVSFDEGKNWKKKIKLWNHASAYSSLAYDNKPTESTSGHLFILFECGRKFPYQQIRFASLPFSLFTDSEIPETITSHKREK